MGDNGGGAVEDNDEEDFGKMVAVGLVLLRLGNLTDFDEETLGSDDFMESIVVPEANDGADEGGGIAGETDLELDSVDGGDLDAISPAGVGGGVTEEASRVRS